MAERSEIYLQGLELANAFQELTDADEQRQRFMADLQYRQLNNQARMEPDERLLAALQHGLPDCSGIALGLDRLVLLAAQTHSLSGVLSFSFERV